jgi:hypothetical protein
MLPFVFVQFRRDAPTNFSNFYRGPNLVPLERGKSSENRSVHSTHRRPTEILKVYARDYRLTFTRTPSRTISVSTGFLQDLPRSFVAKKHCESTNQQF